MTKIAPLQPKNPKPVIGVVGLGTMGLGIAQVFLMAGFRVIATDGYAPLLTTTPMRLAASLDARVQAGKLTQDACNTALRRLRLVDSLDELLRAELVIEAITEDLAAKSQLLAALENVLAPSTVFATNTSSLSVAALAEGLFRPDRVLGMHFFNPAPAMKLVELVGHAGTSGAALQLGRAVLEDAGKVVIVAPDRPGFIVNRCARPFYGEALAMLEEGISAADIDAAMLAHGYKIGPLSLIDLIGADINLAATEGLFAAMGKHPRYHVFDTMRDHVARGDLGRKTGRGFVYPAKLGPAPANAADIALRIEAVLINEAASLLAEGDVGQDSIDTAVMLGMNFPRGPFAALRAHGAVHILGALAALEARAPAHLKGRYVPSHALTEPALS
ncbi:MAG: 3-hydroxybutyryl-CoA dehydrogenase [Rhodoferax sp.]|nr:3-hydroxybutyryl-CoA dehydrogenase [Pseudorhodobacter sp.]